MKLFHAALCCFLLAVFSIRASDTRDTALKLERTVQEKPTFDRVERFEVEAATDRGAEAFIYWTREAISRIVLDFGQSTKDTLVAFEYIGTKLVMVAVYERSYDKTTDGEYSFCSPYPEHELGRIYFAQDKAICSNTYSSLDKRICSDQRTVTSVQQFASDLLRTASDGKIGGYPASRVLPDLFDKKGNGQEREGKK